MDYSSIDEWVSVDDKDSFTMARRLIREEGLLCGGSSGSAAHVAMVVGKNLSSKQTILIILPDSVRNYMSKFIKDDWMAYHQFINPIQVSMNSSLEESNIPEPFSYVEKDSLVRAANVIYRRHQLTHVFANFSNMKMRHKYC